MLTYVGWFPSLARLVRYVGQKPSQWTKFPTVLAGRKLFLRSAYLKHWKDQRVGRKIADGHNLAYTYTPGNTPQTSECKSEVATGEKRVEKRIYDFSLPTTVDGRNPIRFFTRFLHILGGAGILPSTVFWNAIFHIPKKTKIVGGSNIIRKKVELSSSRTCSWNKRLGC